MITFIAYLLDIYDVIEELFDKYHYTLFVSIGWILVFCLFVYIIKTFVKDSKRKKENENKKAEIRDSILNEEFVSSEAFEHDWIVSSSNQIGYKYDDGPGCYVILFFNEPVLDDNYDDYYSVYVGQSIRVFNRVHSHFVGKGNGDVYADLKFGKKLYVKIIPCRMDELNIMEKELIKAFDATKYYNKTQGGSAKR